MGLQIPVKSKLNAGKSASYHADYWDWQLPLLVKYGVPIYLDRNTSICHDIVNHNSAIQHPNHVIHYLEVQIKHGAITGPFTDPHINNLHTNPFMTGDK